MGRSWHERGTYGNILKGIIQAQISKYDRETDRIKATKIAQSIGYLIQVQGGLINSEKNIEERIARIEEVAGITMKGVIPR